MQRPLWSGLVDASILFNFCLLCFQYIMQNIYNGEKKINQSNEQVYVQKNNWSKNEIV